LLWLATRLPSFEAPRFPTSSDSYVQGVMYGEALGDGTAVMSDVLVV